MDITDRSSREASVEISAEELEARRQRVAGWIAEHVRPAARVLAEQRKVHLGEAARFSGPLRVGLGHVPRPRKFTIASIACTGTSPRELPLVVLNPIHP
jgi:hypothetical protein